jgi:ATP-dependent DNA helicase DinG
MAIPPQLPVLCTTAAGFVILTSRGEIKKCDAFTAETIIGKDTPLVCHGAYTAHRLKQKNFRGADILELYAFINPTRFCVPTVTGVAKALGLDPPREIDDLPAIVMESVDVLLQSLGTHPQREKLAAIAQQMQGWFWTPYIIKSCGLETLPPPSFNVWRDLAEWNDEPVYLKNTHNPISAEDTRNRLKAILQYGGQAENRAAQLNYTTRIADNFRARNDNENPHILLAEAGTGVGKTLGYLTPASLWAEENDSSVWISTFTRNLQRQIEQESERIYPDESLRQKKITIRKGRENYVCLLNFEESSAASSSARTHLAPIAAGLMARWIMETKDGDLTGTDFHGWLPGLVGHQFTTQLADQRGECIFSACDHYKRCFSERAIRRAASTSLVVANHAVVMLQTALGASHGPLPQRYIFDEGHHLFTAADSAFAAHLTGQEGYDLRRWIIGPEGGRRSRARGLKKRLEDVLGADDTGLKLLDSCLLNARCLPREEWLAIIHDHAGQNSFEKFLTHIHAQLLSRNDSRDTLYGLETQIFPLSPDIQSTLIPLRQELQQLLKPMKDLVAHLCKRIDQEADTLSSDTRKRMDAVAQSLERRANNMLLPWVALLDNLIQQEKNPDTIDWMGLERQDGRIMDIGIYRHYLNPLIPFAESIKPHAHSIAITSATLRDQSANMDDVTGWDTARLFTGADTLSDVVSEFSIPSPFAYEDATRIFIATDVRKNDPDQLASAYRELFLASGGGALGLFTAIQRLKSVHEKIHEPLAKADITLLAQHIDRIDTGTLVDMFRDDVHSCLLGTDAVRDGVDVPGDSLRLIVFDRVPWPRANILHKARRDYFGGGIYDDRLTRLKLKQAYGRLIRRQGDKGVFVMLDSSLPSRLLSAFPKDVVIERAGLAEIVTKTKEFLKDD